MATADEIDFTEYSELAATPERAKEKAEEMKKTKLLKFDEIGDAFTWGNEGPLYKLTCVNHQTAEYLSKNPFTRSLHIVAYPVEYAFKSKEGVVYQEMGTECPCSFSDLRVVVEVEDLRRPNSHEGITEKSGE